MIKIIYKTSDADKMSKNVYVKRMLLSKELQNVVKIMNVC